MKAILFTKLNHDSESLARKTTHGREVSDEVRRSTRLYLLVGLILFCGTIATAAVATVPALDVGQHGFDKWDALLGLLIASFKASLVAAVFMHLNHEKKFIYVFITLAAIHVTGLFIGIYWHYADLTNDKYFFEAPHPESEG